MSKYSVGLRNVGSYMVSGQPYITGSSINDGEEMKIKFPYVSKNITIRIPSPPNAALDNSTADGSDRIRTADDATNVNDPGVYNLGNTNDFTVSFWFSYEGGGNHIFDLTSGGNRDNKFFRNAAGEFNWTGVAGLSISGISEPGYHHVVITQLTGNVHYYIDNNHDSVTSTNAPAFDDIVASPNVGASGKGDIKIDEITVWNTGMTNAEFLELNNNGEWFNPNYHSKKANLLTWHTMGDASGDNLTSSPVIKDLAGTDEPLNLFSGQPIGVFTSGPFTSQTTGMLRVHAASKADADVYNNFHYKTLQGYGTTISLPMKTKEIYLSAIDSQVSFEVIAELTNIPTGSMYDLAGSGIDE
jgi:hypothetical protein